MNYFDARGEKCFLTKKKFWKINRWAEINVSRIKRKRDDPLLTQKRMEYKIYTFHHNWYVYTQHKFYTLCQLSKPSCSSILYQHPYTIMFKLRLTQEFSFWKFTSGDYPCLCFPSRAATHQYSCEGLIRIQEDLHDKQFITWVPGCQPQGQPLPGCHGWWLQWMIVGEVVADWPPSLGGYPCLLFPSGAATQQLSCEGLISDTRASS